ncbi:MAG TPA: hypothetical protein VJR29_08005, partial [bacterium]|nr:hypothetical protein [bacterium]
MSIPGRSLRPILPSLLVLATAFLGACGKEEAPPPAATPAPVVSTMTLQTPRLQGLSLNGRSIEEVAGQFQDPQTLDAQDLAKAFGINDTAYLDGIMKLIEAQLQSGNPLKYISIYFGGALKSQAARCRSDLGEGVCMIEPYVFNCSEAVTQKNWTEENYLKLCKRLGRLKAYRPERLFAIFEGQDTLAYREGSAPPPPSPSPAPSKGKKAPPPPAAPALSVSQAVTWQPHPEAIDLVRYLQREGIAVFALMEPVTSASLQSWGFAIPPSRIGESDKAGAVWRLLEAELIDRNRRATEASAKLNLEDLRLVLWTSANFDSNRPSDLIFLENVSTVPGGGDLLFIHPYLRGNDKNLTHDPQASEAFKAFIARQTELRPTRLGLWLEQPAVEKNVAGSPGGFLKEVPSAGAAMPEAVPSESLPSATPAATPAASPSAETKPAATPAANLLQPIPPAPPD